VGGKERKVAAHQEGEGKEERGRSSYTMKVGKKR